MSGLTLKILFLDPERFTEEYLDLVRKNLQKLPIIILHEEGAHPAYIVDTKIPVQIKEEPREEAANEATR